jgi:MinD-like ATPase involved in chromosome partitioning or flagellar assembly
MVIAVTGPYGSTGKTTVAINIAVELSLGSDRVLLIDGDLQGHSIANHFLLTEAPSGLGAAVRIAGQNRIDQSQIERLSFQYLKSTLRIMPGSGGLFGQGVDQLAIGGLLESARENFDFTVVDLGSIPVEDQSPQALLNHSVLSQADKSIVVALADPIGIFRLLSIEQQALSACGDPLLIVNRVRNSVIWQARREIEITLQRLSTLAPKAYLADDPAHLDQALRTGVPAAALSRSGSFRQGLTGFVRAELLGLKGQLDSRVGKLG